MKFTDEMREKAKSALKNRKKKSELYPNEVKILTKYFGNDYSDTIVKAVNGSLKNVAKLMCLDCCCFSRSEIAACTIKHCPLYLYRPYTRQSKPAKD